VAPTYQAKDSLRKPHKEETKSNAYVPAVPSNAITTPHNKGTEHVGQSEEEGLSNVNPVASTKAASTNPREVMDSHAPNTEASSLQVPPPEAPSSEVGSDAVDVDLNVSPQRVFLSLRRPC
jgi:hypothetical protein